MIKITVDVQAAAVTASLDALTKGMDNRAGLHGSMAESVANLTRAHLDEKYVPNNKRGDFWARVRNSVEAEANDSEASVTLSELGVRLRYYGGEVRPGKGVSSYTGKPTRALAVPSLAVPIVGGRQIRPGRAGILAFLRKVTGGETVGFLVEGMEDGIVSRGPRKGSKRIVPKPGGALLYTLRTITRHPADKNILPTEAALAARATEAALDWITSHEE